MARVLLDMAVSLDGLICGPGGADGGLYDWYFNPTQVSRPVVDELVSTTGAIIIGRGAFGTGDEAGGWDDTPYRVPHFVVTHRPPWPAPSGTIESVFVPDGVGPQSSSPEKRPVTATPRLAEAPTLPANAWPSAWSMRCSCMWSPSCSAMDAAVRPLGRWMAPDEDPRGRRTERHSSALPRRPSGLTRHGCHETLDLARKAGRKASGEHPEAQVHPGREPNRRMDVPSPRRAILRGRQGRPRFDHHDAGPTDGHPALDLRALPGLR